MHSPKRRTRALLARTAGGQIARPSRRFAVDEDGAGAADGDATAAGPVAEHGRRLAVDEDVLGALDDGAGGIGGIAAARGGLATDRGRRAALRDHPWHIGSGRLGLDTPAAPSHNKHKYQGPDRSGCNRHSSLHGIVEADGSLRLVGPERALYPQATSIQPLFLRKARARQRSSTAPAVAVSPPAPGAGVEPRWLDRLCQETVVIVRLARSNPSPVPHCPRGERAPASPANSGAPTAQWGCRDRAMPPRDAGSGASSPLGAAGFQAAVMFRP